MVTVIDYAVRNDSEGEEFIVLVLQGDMNIIQSQSTGNFYATAYKTTISTTFNEVLAAKMVGKELPGEILKEECDPYEYTNPETGEEILSWCHSGITVDEVKTKVNSAESIQDLTDLYKSYTAYYPVLKREFEGRKLVLQKLTSNGVHSS